MAVTVELEAERAPSGHPHVAQSQVFIDEVLFAHVVDRQTAGGRQLFGIGLDGVGQRLGELGKVEDTNPPFAQVGGHAIGVTKHR
jgi:hypothetical protein